MWVCFSLYSDPGTAAKQLKEHICAAKLLYTESPQKRTVDLLPRYPLDVDDPFFAVDLHHLALPALRDMKTGFRLSDRFQTLQSDTFIGPHQA